MKFDTSFQMKQTQQPGLSPTVIKSLQLLALPYQSLKTFIGKLSLENPFLELHWSEEPMEPYPKVKPGKRADRQNGEHNYMEPADWQDPFESLYESLRLQILSYPVTNEVRTAALGLLKWIDHQGYFVFTREELAGRANIPQDVFYQALTVIQDSSPKGVGAFSLCECLKLQTDKNHKYYDGICYLLTMPDDLEKRNIRDLSRRCGISAAAVNEILAYLSTLNPAPGRLFEAAEPTNYIYPEIEIISNEKQIECRVLNGSSLIVLNEEYYREVLASAAADPCAAEYIETRYQEALQLLQEMNLRQRTLEKLVAYLAQNQNEFFSSPKGQLKPLTMRQAAESLGLHPSTITRCVKDKYIQTRYGVVALRTLFSAGISADGGKEISAAAIKQILRKEIENEPPVCPLTDQMLSERLAAQNITISRRTVVKYREQLKIPSSSKRMRGIQDEHTR